MQVLNSRVHNGCYTVIQSCKSVRNKITKRELCSADAVLVTVWLSVIKRLKIVYIAPGAICITTL